LIQYNLLYFYVDDFAGTTTYEANPHAAYGLLRSGKLLEMAESLFGPAVKDVLQNLLVLGQTRISDLNTAYRTKILERDSIAKEPPPDNPASDEEKPPQDVKPLEVKSVDQLHSVLCQLIRVDIVEVVTSHSLKSPADRLKDVELEVKQKYFPGELKGRKEKEEFQKKVCIRLRELRDLSGSLKRGMEANGIGRSKLRKLFNGDVTNGFRDDSDHALDVGFSDIRHLIRGADIAEAQHCYTGQLGKVCGGVSQQASCGGCVRGDRRDHWARICRSPATVNEICATVSGRPLT